MRTGNTAYVSALSINNGVAAWIAEPATFDAGSITVASNGNGVGTAFYQPQPFTASGDVSVLIPKQSMTESVALFICTLISAEKYRWNYGRKWSTGRLKESEIRLPTLRDGSPDWQFAESYMQGLRLANAALT